MENKIASDNQNKIFNPVPAKEIITHTNATTGQKGNFVKPAETVLTNDNVERMSKNPDQSQDPSRGKENKEKNVSDPDNSDMEEEDSELNTEESSENAENENLKSVGEKVKHDTPNTGMEIQEKPQMDTPTSKPLTPQQPNSYRSTVLDSTYNKTPNTGYSQMKSPALPNQQARKPDSAGYQQSFPNQPRTMYQTTPGYSSSYQPTSPSQPYTSGQLKGDISRSTFHNPLSTPVQRSYSPGTGFPDLSSQQNRPAPRPQMMPSTLTRPPSYSPTVQRTDSFQKIPTVPPIKTNYTTQSIPSTPVNTQYYTSGSSIRNLPLSTSISSPVSLSSSLGDTSLRMYKNDPGVGDVKIKTPSVLNTSDNRSASAYLPSTYPTDPTWNVRQSSVPDTQQQKPKTEEEVVVQKPSEESKSEDSKSEAPETKKSEEEKEPGIVLSNVKLFEKMDTAKTPLTPKLTSPVKPEAHRPVPADVIKGEMYRDEEYESGVDESPMLHPNLRSVNRKRPTDLFGNSSRRINRSKSAGFSTSRDRNSHMSRIDDASARKENIATANGDVHGVKKTPTKLPAPTKRSSSASSPTKTPMKSPGVPKSLPKTPDSPAPLEPLIKKVPMNKIQVGAAPSPNLKTVRSKIGSLANSTHKPGGGNIKIESHKVDFSKAQARIAAKNDTYAPGGGDKKIQQVKLQWSAKPKVGSLDNATHKPGGGDKKIESVKLDFKDKAKPKVGSKDNVKHVPGGGAVKIENQKLEFKAQSKIGSLDNVKHKPGGGDIKIFDDKSYLKQISCGSSEGRASGTQSYCDLSVVSEVHSISAPGTPHHGTAIKIKKSTTLGRTTPEIRKTTEVTVVSRTPTSETKSFVKSPSAHEVKLTYSKVASPKHGNVDWDNVGPVGVINVPVSDNVPVLKPFDRREETPKEVKELISNFEQHITSNKLDMKGVTKGKHEPLPREISPVNEELNQKFVPVKEELDRIAQEKLVRIEEKPKKEEEVEMSKFLRNEMAVHEKVGEMWKEVHNIEPDKPKTEEESLPPPPPSTPSVTQKPVMQQMPMQVPQQQMRPQSPRGPYPQQNPYLQRLPNPQQFNPNMQRPMMPMQTNPRPQFQNPQQMRPQMMGPPIQRPPFPQESGFHPQQMMRPMPPKSPQNLTGDASEISQPSHTMQPGQGMPGNPLQRPMNLPK